MNSFGMTCFLVPFIISKKKGAFPMSPNIFRIMFPYDL
jgi:hypothetical protein